RPALAVLRQCDPPRRGGAACFRDRAPLWACREPASMAPFLSATLSSATDTLLPAADVLTAAASPTSPSESGGRYPFPNAGPAGRSRVLVDDDLSGSIVSGKTDDQVAGRAERVPLAQQARVP